MIPSSVDRVPLHTSEASNEMIERQTDENVARFRNATPEAITRRLRELDEEWDIERTLEANAATASLVGLTLGFTVSRKFLLFPAAVAGFLLQHAIQGWCPPLPIFRRLGYRTQTEIERERMMLKALRGDFHELVRSSTPLQTSDLRKAVDE